MSNTYSTRATAVRGATRARIDMTRHEIVERDGRWAIVALTPTIDANARMRRSVTPKGACARVHDIVRANPGATRKALMAMCDAQGIAYFTARTQIQKALRARA